MIFVSITGFIVDKMNLWSLLNTFAREFAFCRVSTSYQKLFLRRLVGFDIFLPAAHSRHRRLPFCHFFYCHER